MVSFILKVILHVAENDSKYHDIAPLRGSKKRKQWGGGGGGGGNRILRLFVLLNA